MNLTLWWIKPLAISLTVIALYLSGYYKGYEYEKTKLDTFKATVSVEAKAQEEHNKIVITQQAKVTADVVQAYSDSVNKLKAYYETHNRILTTHSNVVRVSPSSGEVSRISSTAEPVNANTESPRSSASGTQTEGVTAEDCSVDVLTLLELQHWITQQQLLNP